jgi:hypothetical protein
MSTMSGLHLEQLQEVVEQQRAEIERWKLTVALREAEIERLRAALQALADDASVPPWIRTLALESKP